MPRKWQGMRWVWAGCMLAGLAVPPATAQESELVVEEAAVATGMERLAPVGVASTFPADTERIYCYTKITGGQEGDEIIHQWMKGDQVMASPTLKIKASPWRTYSMKTMPQDALGKWVVKIMQEKRVLKVVPFEIVE